MTSNFPNKLLTFILATAFLLTLSLTASAADLKALNSKFIASYESYQEAVKTNSGEQLSYALKAYQLGKQVYGEDDINTANLAFNLAEQHLNNNDKKQAKALLLTALKIFEKTYGNEAIELVDIYLALGKSTPYKNKNKAVGYYYQALDIADEHKEKHPFYNAQTQLDVGAQMLRFGLKKSRIILSAQTFFTKNLVKDDNRVVRANFYAGKYYLAKKRYKSAIDNFELNLPVFDALEGPTHPLALNTHAFLINAHESRGNSEEATKHCIAIGSMSPWDDNQEQRPLLRTAPEYPISSARLGKTGWVKIGFTVSKSGRVKNAKVIESEGGKNFEKSALAALEKWRYAPKFENGQPIEAYTTTQLDFKVE